MSETVITRLNTNQVDFNQCLKTLLAWESVSSNDIAAVVDDILHQVKSRGDDAVIEYTNKFDRRNVKNACDLMIAPERLHAALNEITPEQQTALNVAAERIKNYHKRQMQSSWQYTEEDGTVLGQKVCHTFAMPVQSLWVGIHQRH